jgi:NADP-dependent 3-hydroxy acid dehydrogenase YdfG
MSMSTDLAGKVALVTGASSGIGAAAARALAQAGASVTVAARRADRLSALVAEIEAAGGRAGAFACDFADSDAAQQAVAETVKRFGRIDILVNSAGRNAFGAVEAVAPAAWRDVMDLNFMGTLAACHAAIPHMLAQGAGDIVNISSTAGRKASANAGPYCASKFAVNAMSESLRQEVGRQGIRVCVLEPGATRTEGAEHLEDPVLRERIHKHLTRDGAMAAEDVARTIVFILSLPRNCNVQELLIRPTDDVAAM